MHIEISKFEEIVRNTPLIAIDLFIINERSLLIGKRKNAPGLNTYFVPGGRIKKDENIYKALNRILLNETNLTFKNKSYRPLFIGIDEHFYEDNFLKNKNFSTHYVVLMFILEFSKLEKIDNRLTLKNQHHNFVWFNKNVNNELSKSMNKYMKGYLEIAELKKFIN